MNKFALFCATGATLLAGVSFASAYDSDPGNDISYGSSRGSSSNPSANSSLRPTQRYYGKGYTVAYRYVPVVAGRKPLYQSSNFQAKPSELLATNAIPSSGSQPLRITYYYQRKSTTPRTFNTISSDTAIVKHTKPVNPSQPAPPPIAEGPVKQ